eukprot:jgi/Phyca11/12959/fgenesh1_pg.PHYCAscaffold_2_\
MMRTDSQATSGMVEWIDEQCCHGLDDDHHNVLAQDLADATRMYTKKTNTSHEDVNEVAEASETMDNTVVRNRTTGDGVNSDNGSKDHDRDEHLQNRTRPMETRVLATRVLLEVTDGSNSEAAMGVTEAAALVMSPVPKPEVIPAESLDLTNDVRVDHQDAKDDTNGGKAETRTKMAQMVEVGVTLEKARKPLNPTVRTEL